MNMATQAHKGKPRVEREAKLAWVPFNLMRVSPLAQRDINQGWVNEIAAGMDLEELGYPHVNHRDGYWYIIDGQHRVEAYKLWDEDWQSQQIQCFTYEGLTEKQEADKFLKLNKRLNVSPFETFKVGLQAGHAEELAIAAIVSHLDMNISKQRSGLSISAVGTLRRVFRRGGPKTLRRALFVIRDAYGQAGLEAPVIEGISLVVQRYSEDILGDDMIIKALTFAAAGVSGLLNTAEVTHRSTGQPKSHCLAAAVVELVRKRQGGRRVQSWWRQENGHHDGEAVSTRA